MDLSDVQQQMCLVFTNKPRSSQPSGLGFRVQGSGCRV